MRISTWITSLYICGLISVNEVVGEPIKRLYGEHFTLHCGRSSLPGEWFHNALSTSVNNITYTITNADFSHDGEYQCKRNGVDVLSELLVVLVYGRRSITALSCNSISNGVCMRNVVRGQPVTLCATFTTIPPLIPEGERVSNLTYSFWSFKNSEGNNVYLYSCTTSSCSELSSTVDYSPYTYINISCLTIDDVQENGQYTLHAFFDPQHSPRPSVIFNVTSVESPVADISHNVTQGEILCSTQDYTTYPGDRYCLYVEDSGGERHEVECDDRPVSGNVKELRSRGNTAVCTVNRTIANIPVYGETTYEILGQLGISPTNCDSKLNDICVHTIHPGESVELCTIKTLIPSTPPQGCVTKFIRTPWCKEKSEGNENLMFSLELLVNPDIEYSSRTVTFAIRINASLVDNPPPMGDTDDIHVVLVPVVVSNVLMIVFIVIAVKIFIKYRLLKLITNPTQSDSPQEPPSSSPSNLTVYRKKDVKRFEKIGRGSFWKVYRGKLSDSRCAIKRLRGVKKGEDHEGLVSKVFRELDMWSSLNHPNVITLYGTYHEDDINIPLLIIELMDKNLTDQLISTLDPTHRKSLFPLNTKLFILSQVAGALDYLHCIKRVIHGDLTANNILLKENSPGSFTSKLTDFGMSRALNEQDNVMSTVQGTYSYMPPEVQNAGETTTKVDIYSFGVLCVHVLSHKFPKPRHARSVDDLGARVVSEFIRYRHCLMELNDDEKLLEPLIEECLQYQPEDRLRPEELIGQLNSIEGRLRLKETGPANPNHQPSVIHNHQQFSGPIVSGCTISGSVMNVGSFTNGNMQMVPVVDTAPLPAPLEVVPEVSFGDNMPNTSTSLTAPSEVNPHEVLCEDPNM